MPRIERYTITIPNNAIGFIPSDATTHLEEERVNKVSKKQVVQNNKKVATHSQPDQICIGRACSCKKMHGQTRSGFDDITEVFKNDHGHTRSGYDDSTEVHKSNSDRNQGRKPRYKDHMGRLGKSGELRAAHKRPTHHYDFL
ncbi:hypothetical protein K9M47_00110 [Candidatus Gracilibacteria bacterium]|nr:hypothetical protein [Candidatus Gracilibacteria bacterium]MCF7898380.1 hypothetical protein [Candidatus Paceibacterota bacterium]